MNFEKVVINSLCDMFISSKVFNENTKNASHGEKSIKK